MRSADAKTGWRDRTPRDHEVKTVRFTAVVERSGRPRVHAFWTKPERDPEFQRARKAGRVMMLEPGRNGKADVGTVGYDRGPAHGTEVLIFPKSLRPFEGQRVVGVKFELIDQPPTVAAKPEEAWATRTPKRSKPAPPDRRDEPARPDKRPDLQTPSPTQRNRHMRRTQPAGRHAHLPQTAKAFVSSGGQHRSDLKDDVRAALAELRAGRAGAAYRRLHDAISLDR